MVHHLRLPKQESLSTHSSISTLDDTEGDIEDAERPATQPPPITSTTFQSTLEENAELDKYLVKIRKRIASQLRHVGMLLTEAKEET